MFKTIYEKFKKTKDDSGNNNAQQEGPEQEALEAISDSQHPAPPHNQDSSTIKTAAKFGAGVLAAVAVAATGGIAMPFIAPVSASLFPVLSFYTAGSAVTVAAAAGVGVVTAQKVEQIIKKQEAKKLKDDEDQPLTEEVALTDIGSEDLRPEVSAAAAAPIIQPQTFMLAADSELNSAIAMANEDVDAAIKAVTIHFARCGLELTSSSSALSPTRGAQTKVV